MTTQQLKCFAISQAVKLVATQNIENKTKAVLDFANDIVRYVLSNNIRGESGFDGEKEYDRIVVSDFDYLEQIVHDDHVQKYVTK